MWDRTQYQKLYDLRRQAAAGGGPERVRQRHEAGKLTARERLEVLFDPGTFVEIGGLIETRNTACGMDARCVPGDGVVTGYGKINGRLACASSEDFTVIGGTLGEAHAEKICAIQDLAMEMRVPIILINDSGGARIEEGVASLNGYSGMFLRNTRASGVIPQIAAVMGPCAGGACYSPAICDFIFMVEESSYMFVTGPKVVKTVTGETISAESLGGARVHTTESGVAHFSYPDDRTCLEGIRALLSYLPRNAEMEPPVLPGTPVDRSAEIEEIVPQNSRKPYDVRKVIETMADADSFCEVQSRWAANAVVGLGRMDGRPVGFVANQPSYKGGSLDRDSSDKMARFIRTCDCFHIPLVILIDVPAFLPGMEQEHGGIIRHGAKLLYAFSEATVPKISLIMRKAYGGAYIAMNSKRMGADMVFAWPIAEIAVMGAEGAVEILYRRDLQADPAGRGRLVEEYRQQYMNPYLAAARGYIDEVVEPEDTRRRIAAALEALSGKPRGARRHGNIPL
ncbi:MAG: acyl-CoA carboxylase subunit beta [Oscillibacter sp.]|nr:acyl-CoA carboxylase subunit beta [uncultured Oscillibacter sp.]MCI8971886.1 acyl-CoA carboxylase subunit beta [Oscillibacter sp.]